MKRAAVALLSCMLAVFASNSSPVRAADNETPVLIPSQVTNGGPAAPGDTVSVNYVVQEPGGSGVQTVVFYFLSPPRSRATIQARADGPGAITIRIRTLPRRC